MEAGTRTPRRRRRGLTWMAAVTIAIVTAAALTLRRDRVQAPARSAPADPDVLLITVDTLRPDALGWVAGRNATPAIDRLAASAFRFPAAVAPVPLTLPSHAALMTGLLPRRLGLRDNGQIVPAGPQTLAEALATRGYATGAFISGYPLDSGFGLDRGFHVYDDTLAPGNGGDLERTADETVEAALRWVRTAASPRFVWVHFYDPHHPYEPPAAHRRPGARGPYDGEVAFVDEAVGRLAAAFGRDALTVFAADHGESLGEHGEGTHGFFVYDSTVLVPLFFRWEGRVPAGSSAAAVRLLDVMPTVLDLLGAPVPAGVDGVSVRATLESGADFDEPAYVETFQPWQSYGWAPLEAMRHRGVKLIAAPRPELYDLIADPGETRNVIAARAAEASALSRLLAAAQARPAPAPATVDREARARLEALGYASAGAASADPPAEGLRDPKDGTALREMMTEGDLRLRGGDPAGAVARFDAVLREEPKNRFALLRSGVALSRMGAIDRAVARLRRVVRLDPANPDARIALAESLSAAGRHRDSLEHWMEAARLQPERPEVWANLGSALGASGRVKDAPPALARAVELKPDDPRLRARLAFAEHAAGRLDAAARHLKEAAARQGTQFAHSGALGLILVELGRPAEAREWLARSGPREPEHAEAMRALGKLAARPP